MEPEKLNYCPNCHVFVDSSLADCPLCRQHLEDHPSENPMYPDVGQDVRPYRQPLHGFYGDLLLFLSFVFTGTAIVFNIIYWRGTPWFLAVASPILYVWIVLRTFVFNEYYFGTRVFLQLLGLMAMFLSFDLVAGWTGWSINYALPLLLMVSNVLIDAYSGTYKSRWKDNLMFAFLFVVLGCLPLIFYCTHITNAFFPMLLSTVASAVSALGMLRFAVRSFAQELKKRLHV